MPDKVTHTCNGAFRRFGGGDQATEDHHHGQAAGDPQKCLQKLAEASTPRQGAAVLGDGAGHESSAGGGFNSFSFTLLQVSLFLQNMLCYVQPGQHSNIWKP